ncbi:MAG: TPD domain-containing protein [Archaeoglobales archaeon]|nr:TPD domain-containing protein [Archaeoglobales archaeon]
MKIKLNEYFELRRSLKSIRSLDYLPYPRALLHSILIQKRMDSVRKKYHLFSKRSAEIVDLWRRERKFPEWLSLPPVMKIRILMKGLGYSAREIGRMLRNPEVAEDDELRNSLWKAVTTDYVYSPIAAKIQTVRGKMGEKLLGELVDKLGVEYKTEHEIGKTYRKTPDVLFEKTVKLNGREVRWIESKALFGDIISHSRYFSKQYSHYRELFGDGVVIYWLGCIDEIDALTWSDLGCDTARLLNMEIVLSEDGVKLEGNEIEAAMKAVDAYAEGFSVATSNQKVLKILRNMGFKLKNAKNS